MLRKGQWRQSVSRTPFFLGGDGGKGEQTQRGGGVGGDVGGGIENSHATISVASCYREGNLLLFGNYPCITKTRGGGEPRGWKIISFALRTLPDTKREEKKKEEEEGGGGEKKRGGVVSVLIVQSMQDPVGATASWVVGITASITSGLILIGF